MKIIVLHGDDTSKSYERLSKFIDEAVKRDWDILDYDYDSITNQSLFEKERFYILRDVKKLSKEILEKLKTLDGNLIIYHTNTIAATTLKTYNASKVEKFELPKTLWNFLDNFSLKQFQEVIKTEAVEMVSWWIGQRLKELYWVKYGNPNINAWRITKLKSQLSKLKHDPAELISELSQIDIDGKTGVRDLKTSLDLFLVRRLA